MTPEEAKAQLLASQQPNSFQFFGGLAPVVAAGALDTPATLYGLAQAAYSAPREGEGFFERAERHHDRFPFGQQTGALYEGAQDFASGQGLNLPVQIAAEVATPLPSLGKAKAVAGAVGALAASPIADAVRALPEFAQTLPEAFTAAIGPLFHGTPNKLQPTKASGGSSRWKLEDDPANLQFTPDVTQSSVVGLGKRGPSPSYLEQREIADEIVRRPENIERSKRAIEENLEDGKAWYNTTPIREAAEDILSPEEAEAYHRTLMASMGPTSVSSKVPQNIDRGLWATAANRGGIPITALDPSSRANVFGPQGHPYYFTGMQPGLERIDWATLEGLDPLSEAYDPVAHQKTNRYTQNLFGNYQNVPGDMWETRRHFGLNEGITEWEGKGLPWKTTKRASGGTGDAPSRAEHDAIEQLHREILAPHFGLHPAQSMAGEWIDLVSQRGGDARPFMQIFNERLAGAAQRAGKSPRQVFGQIARGTFPKEQLGGLVGPLSGFQRRSALRRDAGGGRFGDFHVTHERVPSASSGHLPEVFSDPAMKGALESDPRRSWETAAGTDSLYDALGMPNRPGTPHAGVFENKTTGVKEFNEGRTTTVDVRKDSKERHKVARQDMERIESAETIRGYLDAQEASAGHTFSAIGKDGVQGADATAIGIAHGALSDPQTRQLAAATDAAGYTTPDAFPMARTDNTVVQDFGQNPAQIQGRLKSLAADIEARGVDAKLEAGAVDTVYIDFSDARKNAGSGKATQMFLDAYDSLSAAEQKAVHKVIRKMARRIQAADADLASAGATLEEGIENSRKFLTEGGVPALRKAMNNGTVLPAIGMPILGGIAAKLYSEEVSTLPEAA